MAKSKDHNRIYEQLAELKDERATLIPVVEALPEVRRLKALDAAINGLEQYAEATRQRTGSRIVSTPDESEFAGLSLPKAGVKFLERVKEPQTADQIWDALHRGGMTLTARRPTHAVYKALQKHMTKNHRLQCVGAKWSLLPVDLSKGGVADGDLNKHRRLTKEGIAHFKARTGGSWGAKPKITAAQIEKFRELFDSGKCSVAACSRQAGMSNAYFYMHREAILKWKKGDPWPLPPQQEMPLGVSGDELRAMGIIPMHARLIGEDK